MSYSFLLKYIVIGNSSVGKSCLLMQFIDKTFKIESDPTIGVQFGSKSIAVKNKDIKLQIWDTAGQEAFKSITRSYYRGTIGAVLVYDIANRKSFNDVQKWMAQAKDYATNDKIVILLVGNKEDLSHSRQVTPEEGRQFAERNGMLFVECSAKTGYNVDCVFDTLSLAVLQKIEKGEIDPRDESSGIKIGVKESFALQRQRKCC